METIGKLVLFLGLGLTALGGVIWALGKAGFKGLPGDIHHKSEGFQFHFPVVTCIALSILLSLAMWIWRWFQDR